MIQYIVLGIVQGITEFLPVSSSGHLAILERLFGLSDKAIAISIVMHGGTLAAVLVFFWRETVEALCSKRMVLFILVVTCITGVIGVTGKDFFESLFTSVKAIALGWLATGAILLLTKYCMAAKRTALNMKDAMILGVTQGIAIIPGVSRSGLTVSTMLFRGVEKMTGFAVSFLVSIPVIAGAALLEAKKIHFALSGNPAQMAVGFLCSFCSGLLALWVLKRSIARSRFHYFAYYCFVIAAITFIWIK
jgi:undecaprenyl-diphosphatase